MSGKVVYITDTEGNLDYFKKCIELSGEGISLSPDDKEIVLEDGWTFVFGGDACDKGPGSLRIEALLVAAKRRYGARVVFILGNRDINKLRFRSELSDAAMREQPDVPYGMPRTTTGYVAFLAARAAATNRALSCAPSSASGGAGGAAAAASLSAAEYDELNTRANRLRWILEKTMGAEGNFEHRQAELAALAAADGAAAAAIGDEAVVASFLNEVGDEGVTLALLRHGQLAYVHGVTLYVHGGLVASSYAAFATTHVTASPLGFEDTGGRPLADGAMESCVGVVPGQPGRHGGGVADWVGALNGWFRQAVEDSVAGAQPNTELLQQYVSYGTWPSVVTSRHLNSKSQPVPLPPAATAALLAAGLRRLVVGHTPHGNCPTVIPGAVQTVLADTSYSDMSTKERPKPDNRGLAATVLKIDGERLDVVGQLEDTTKIAYTVLCAHSTTTTQAAPTASGAQATAAARALDEHDPLIGAGEYGGWWVKAKLARAAAFGSAGGSAEEPRYLLCRVEGFSYQYDRKTETEVRAMLEAKAP